MDLTHRINIILSPFQNLKDHSLYITFVVIRIKIHTTYISPYSRQVAIATILAPKPDKTHFTYR